MLPKRFVFVVAADRSGTGLLARLLKLFPGVTCKHEPKPEFSSCMQSIQYDRELATQFLLNKKYPHIEKKVRRSTYIETSHFFCKGFFEAWCESGLPTPNLIMLDRNPRKLAKSLMKRNCIPGRTEEGRKHCLSPDKPGCYLAIPDWQSLSDYQLCYWHALEIEERKRVYADIIRERGGRITQTSIELLTKESGFEQLRRQLRLEPLTGVGHIRYRRICHAQLKIRMGGSQQPRIYNFEQIKSERELTARIQHSMPELRRKAA